MQPKKTTPQKKCVKGQTQKKCLSKDCQNKAPHGYKYCSVHHARLLNNDKFQSYLTDIPRSLRNMNGTDFGDHGDGAQTSPYPE